MWDIRALQSNESLLLHSDLHVSVLQNEGIVTHFKSRKLFYGYLRTVTLTTYASRGHPHQAAH